ncbi:MAG: putative beta-lysine N-acetyltransferase [Imperialibacter sp.]|uniref:putative beta-lysine N-acetyltransferase n=1 Tax=Imperialibacter sp. TaxID=2038411 RepID=UPI0032EF8A8B
MNSIIKNGSASITLYSDSFNKRIRIDDYSGDAQEVLALIARSEYSWVEKIIVKAREEELPVFLSNGYSKEALIKGYFQGVDMHFLAKYQKPTRGSNPGHYQEEQMIESILSQPVIARKTDTQIVSVATVEDADGLAQLYAAIFNVYPTPVNESAYILKTMQDGTKYVVIREQNKIVSAASAEINAQYGNAELTDCGTLPEARGKGHIKKLLSKLEEVLAVDNIQCLYTIARAESYAMNKAFYQLGYCYGGTLINNCYIFSGLEDMNVWHKAVQPKVST